MYNYSILFFLDLGGGIQWHFDCNHFYLIASWYLTAMPSDDKNNNAQRRIPKLTLSKILTSIVHMVGRWSEARISVIGSLIPNLLLFEVTFLERNRE